MPPKRCALFTNEREGILIQEVRSRPILWDVSLQQYRRTDLKDQHWEAIAHILGLEFTGSTVQARFKSMRKTFMENNNKIKASKTSGSGTDDVFKPKWALYDQLMFLQKTCLQTEGVSNIPTVSSQVPREQNSGDILLNLYDETLQQFVVIPPDNEEDQDQSNSSHSEMPPPSCPISVCNSPSPTSSTSSLQTAEMQILDCNRSRPPRPASDPSSSVSVRNKADDESFVKRGACKRKANSAMDEAVHVLREISSQPVMPAQDSAETLGSFVASRLRAMDPESRRKCENEIMKVLTQY